MRLRNAWMLLLVSVVMLSLGQSAYAQSANVALPVVPDGSVPYGEARPYLWMMSILDPSAVVHAPGQTNCGPNAGQNVCYYFPSDLTSAYATTLIQNGKGGAGITVGIVDAFYNPQTEADLAAFNTFFGLPACTIASGCLTIVSQTGGVPTAGFNAGWAQETNLDVQWVHALAPNAKILLVTATTNSFANLGAAVMYAEANSDVVSNSYGAPEFAGESTLDFLYSGSPVPVLFSSGDVGAESQYPCASIYVTCVGGTHLLSSATHYRTVESAWSGSGGGCSIEELAPAYQSGFSTGACNTARGMPDVAALADPYTGAIVRLGTNASGGAPGYYVFGGTSLACPMTAAIVANIDSSRVTAGKTKLGANLAQLVYQGAAMPFYHYRYYDVTTGTSGFPAVMGWDEATGLGVPMSPSLTAYLDSLP